MKTVAMSSSSQPVSRAFYARDVALARLGPTCYDPVPVSVYSLSVCLSVCPSQVGVLSKPMDGSSWFLAHRLLSTYPYCVVRKLRYCIYEKEGYFLLELCPKLQTLRNFATAYRWSKRVIDLA